MPWFRETCKQLFSPWIPELPPPSIVPKEKHLRSAIRKASATEAVPRFPIKPPEIPAGVVPEGSKAAIAMDGMECNPSLYAFANTFGSGMIEGFPGYPYLSVLALRAEYRAFASSLSTELTREWIALSSSETAGAGTKKKVTEITQEITRLGLQQVIQRVAEHDCYFGRGQILIDLKGHNRALPLILDKRTIKLKSLNAVKAVEPIWTTPSAYNASDPAAPDFYKPSKWFMLGQQIHASRLLTVITRPVPDIYKPAFNFSGMSMSQLAEPYVNNWLRTRQAVSDLINNFSTTAIATSMAQVLQGGEGSDADGTDLIARADLFTALRSNKGVMLIDKETEEIVQVNTPLSGLSELQAQAQEHMCSVSRMPAIVLTGISPTGLNASSEGEIRVFYDWVMAMLEANYRDPIDTIIKIIQLSLYGEIDKDILFTFNPLYQMTPKELSDIRKADAETAGTLIDRAVIAPQEERERLARDPNSGYQGLDVDAEIEAPNAEEEGDKDEDKE